MSKHAGNWLLLVGMAGASTAGAASFAVVDLGSLSNLPGQNESRPNAVNAGGRIAIVNAIGGAYQALLYDGSANNLGTLGGSHGFAAGINAAGWVAGFSTTTAGFRRAFLWTPDGQDGVPGNRRMKELGTLSGGSASEAYAINTSGQITGYSQTSGRDHAFRYSNGVMTDIGLLVSGPKHSYGFDINDAGDVAGTAYNNSYNSSVAILYRGGSVLEIPGWDGGDSTALALNDHGMVIGYASVGGGHEHAFAYANNNLRDLGTLGGNYSYAIDVNDRNVVVGGSFTDAADTVYHAFVSVGETMVDLNGQLDASGAGWVLIEARAINDAGQIVGTGRRNGSYRAFLLNPKTAPPPTITRINRQGADVVIEFSTVAGAVYRLEDRSGVGGGAWAALGDAMSGIDGQTVVTNLGGGGQTMRFYRVSVAPQ